MKKVLLISALIFWYALSAFAQDFHHVTDFVVGVQPTKIYFDEKQKLFHIFCAGLDVNYNGVKDSGDVAPSWWAANAFPLLSKYGIISGNVPVKVMDWNFGSWDWFAPFNPGFDWDNSILYVCQNGIIRSYDMANFKLLNDSILQINASALMYDSGKLYISQRNYPSGGSVFIYDLNSKTITDSIVASDNVQKVKLFMNGIAILNEGNFGANDSRLLLAKKISNNWRIDTILLGNGANDFDIMSGNAVVAMNASNEIVVVSLSQASITTRFSTGTTGYDGPRNVLFYTPNEICVSTYSGNLKFYDLSGNQLASLTTPGKTEGFDFQYGTYLLSANEFTLGTYNADSLVSLYSVPQSVNEKIIKPLNVFPNPSNGALNIDCSDISGNSLILTISDISGNIVFSRKLNNYVMNESTITLSRDETGLSNGSYLITLNNGTEIRYSKINVIK